MVVLYSLTLFLAALLTFSIQPMVARMVLPYFGGSSSVWNTCVLFFQAGMFAGYAYAHFTPRWLGIRNQKVLHFVLLGVAISLLPVAVAGSSPPRDFPIPIWLLFLLVLHIGLPYFVVATTAPLAQRWFSLTKHRHANDPYFLYAASNCGSLLSLVLYPAFLETCFTLPGQGYVWAGGYIVLVVLLAFCAFVSPNTTGVIKSVPLSPKEGEQNGSPEEPPNKSVLVDWKVRLQWLILAFIPSTLMLSVTTYLSTDIAPIPLLWVTPLGIYLFTFILAFSKFPHQFSVRVTPLVILIVALLLLSQVSQPLFMVIPIHLCGLFVIALFCHGELANLRPSADQLTEFYLWVSVGGMVGGMFSSLVAPVIFDDINEYSLAIILACAFLRGKNSTRNWPSSWREFFLKDCLPAIGLCALTAGIILVLPKDELPLRARMLAVFGLPVALTYVFHERSLRYALCLVGLFVAATLNVGVYGVVEFGERTFYGIHRVSKDPDGKFRRLVHGNTNHGQQFLDPERRREPLSYYHREGPVGSLFRRLTKSKFEVKRVGVVGLGIGSMAAYGKKGQEWTYYEIDPVVRDIAQNPEFFTFLRDSTANVNVVIGDARIQLAKTDARYDVMVIDAFNSDSVPVHLLTKEALALYLERLEPKGVIAFHISNRYLNLEPVLSTLAKDAGLLCYSSAKNGEIPRVDPRHEGMAPSHWILIGRKNSVIQYVVKAPVWSQVDISQPKYLWTDNFSNLLTIFRWQ